MITVEYHNIHDTACDLLSPDTGYLSDIADLVADRWNADLSDSELQRKAARLIDTIVTAAENRAREDAEWRESLGL